VLGEQHHRPRGALGLPVRADDEAYDQGNWHDQGHDHPKIVAPPGDPASTLFRALLEHAALNARESTLSEA